MTFTPVKLVIVCTAIELHPVSWSIFIDQQYLHQHTVPEQPKDLPVGSNLPLLLVVDLRKHELKLPLHIIRMEIPPDTRELAARLLDLASADQIPRRVGHERNQSNEHDNAPGDLDTQRQPPLHGPIGRKATGEADPVRCHGSKGDSAT
jgi:hypothetical protein